MELDGPLVIRPHRAYRRLARLEPVNLTVSLGLVALLEVALALRLEELTEAVTRFALFLVPTLEQTPELVRDDYVVWALARVAFEIPSASAGASAAWLGAALVVVALLFVARPVSPPLRVWAGFVAATIAASAAYLLAVGDLGFDGDGFSRLYVQTTAVVWLLLPLVCGALSFSLPLTALERLGLVVVCVTADIALGAVRYAVFVWLLASFGPVPMPTLYLLLGPLLDFVYLMGLFAVFLFVLTRRLERGAAERVWTWL